MSGPNREPTLEERFLAELRVLRSDPASVEHRPMLARFRARRYSGGPGGSDLSSGTLIPTRDAVMVYLWSTDAAPGDRPGLIAHMVAEPEACWDVLTEPAPVVVRGRLERGAALVVETDGCRLESLHPAKTRALRSPRL